MEIKRLSRILGRCSKETIEKLAQPIMKKYPVHIIRKTLIN